jgi:transglutaminase-like putative cysteine protease
MLLSQTTAAGLFVCLGSVAPGPVITPAEYQQTGSKAAFSVARKSRAAGHDDRDTGSRPKSRTFLFTYSTHITGLPPGKAARIWLPVPPSNADQEVRIVSRQLPGEAKQTTEEKHGNQMLYLEAPADEQDSLALAVTYRVTRHEVRAQGAGAAADSADQMALYLHPDRMVPVSGKPLDLIKDTKLPQDQLAAARVLYDIVNNHMRYSKEGKGWGRGDAVWACSSGYGNCTDFHSLFMSLARAEKIPVKFEIGFPLPPQRGPGEIPGYHCWVKFHPAGHGWIPADISEANKNPRLRDYYFGNLSEDRIAFSTGRDLVLTPRQDGPPLNFFVYPYVEVGGKPYPADKIHNKFTFQDVPAGPSH